MSKIFYSQLHFELEGAKNAIYFPHSGTDI